MQTRHTLSACLALTLLSTFPAAASAQGYTITDLGTLGGDLANAFGINDLGVVVGQADTPGFNTQAFVWSNGVMTAVPGLSSGDSGRADGVNDLGHVVGFSMASSPGGFGLVGHAFFWSPGTGTLDLTPTATANSQARAVNVFGQVAGSVGGPAGGARMWTVGPGGQVTTTAIALPGAPAGFSNDATDINASGWVVGTGFNAAFEFRAWRWTGSGDAVELPNLGGVQTEAEGVNDAGEICGTAQLPTGQVVPVKWLPGGAVVQLGLLPLPNVIGSEVRGINNLGHVVGAELYVDPVTGLAGTAPWVWINGAKQALNDLLSPAEQLEWTLTSAFDISDAGHIVGIAIRNIGGIDFPGRAFLLVPGAAPVVPTPLCFGDDNGAACPCGNTGNPATGCANSAGPGAMLSAGGSTSVSTDDLVLPAGGMVPGQPALLFAGTGVVAGGNGAAFGDGLRCAGGGVRRLGVRQANAFGEATFGPGLAPSGGWSAGETRFLQAWYRDPVGGPCGTGFNLSQALEIVFAP